MEAKAHDKIYGGYIEWFSEDWTPIPPGDTTYMGEPDLKLMNTHLHLLEAMTAFYRASQLPLARERLLELIAIQSNAVVRKGLGACTDKYQRNWEPVLTGDYARVSYGHDLENIWLLNDACDAAGISNYPLLDLYRALFDYALKYGFDEDQGGFFLYGPFNQPAQNREKIWWVQSEACVSALYMYRLTHDARYLRVFEKTYDWIEKHQVDWKNGEWFDTIMPDGTPRGDKAQIWKCRLPQRTGHDGVPRNSQGAKVIATRLVPRRRGCDSRLHFRVSRTSIFHPDNKPDRGSFAGRAVHLAFSADALDAFAHVGQAIAAGNAQRVPGGCGCAHSGRIEAPPLSSMAAEKPDSARVSETRTSVAAACLTTLCRASLNARNRLWRTSAVSGHAGSWMGTTNRQRMPATFKKSCENLPR